MQTFSTNVCIIGAGPGGATTSLFLCKMGIPHIILDAAVFPRDKVCGDGLDLKVMRVLNQLDPTIVENEILDNDNFSKAWGCRIITSKRVTHLLYKPNGESDVPYPFFMVCKREYFDNFLLRKINPTYADLRTGTKVKRMIKTGDVWKIVAENAFGEININANLVIGADGDHSIVLRSLGERKVNKHHYAAGIRQYWKGIKDIHPKNCVEIYCPKKLPLAYLWIFPLPNGEANVGCGLISDIVSEKSVNLKELLHELITTDPALASRFVNAQPLEKPTGWGLPLASLEREAAGDGWLLVGDAASLICPTTGEGIGPAMMSGYIAAHFIKRAVENNRFDKGMFSNYQLEITKRLKDDIKSYKLIRSISPHLYNWTINGLTTVGVSQYYFKKKVAGWVRTARKPIEVNL